jgi:hypothetical protein
LRCLLVLSGIAVLGIVRCKVLNRLDPFAFLALCLFAALVWIYGSHILAKKSTAVGGCDSYAYLQGAVNMARHGLFHTEFSDPLIPRIREIYKVKPHDNQLQFFLSPHGHYVHDLSKGLIYNVFPPGMSLLLLPLVKIAGISASFYVLPFLTLLFLLLFFYFGTKRVDIHFGICLAAFVFFNRDVFGNTVLIMSDVPSMMSLAGSFFLLNLSFKTSKRYLVVLSAALFGFAVMLRYPNVLGGLPLLYLFFTKYRLYRRPKDIIKDALWFGALALTQKLTRLKLLKFLLVALLAVYPLYRSLPLYPMGNFSEEKKSLQIKKSVEANAVVFCDFHSGSLRLYADLTAYRNNWTPDFFLRDTVLILSGFRLPVYFFLDSPPSAEYFQDLIHRGYLDPQKIRLISRISGFPLYKYGDN